MKISRELVFPVTDTAHRRPIVLYIAAAIVYFGRIRQSECCERAKG